MADVLAAAGHAPPPEVSPTLPEVAAAFAAIEAASGPARKSAILRELLERSDPATAKGIVKVLCGDLRIGLREGLVEAAIAKAFDRPLDDVKWAGMLVGDVGRLAGLARDDALGSAALALFHPLKFMLASPAEDAAEIITRLGPEVWVEDKYDGIRAQLHKRGTDVRLYSRDLHDVEHRLTRRSSRRPGRSPGTASSTARSSAGATGRSCRSSRSRRGSGGSRRRRRSRPRSRSSSSPSTRWRSVPAATNRSSRCFACRSPSGARASTRSTCRRSTPAVGSPARTWSSPTDVDALEAAFAESRARRNEGLMVKDPESRYAPGRRGLGWLKMKKALATIDCVVVGVEVGHGKRHGVLSDYTFAVRDTATDKLVNIGKAYSGLTDAEIAEMTRWFEAHTIARYGRYHQVEPTVVVEIAFDVIVRSARHGSGFSLRFPRIARLRPDKTVDEIDTVETVTALYEGLQHGSELLVTAGSRPARGRGRAVPEFDT